MSPPPLRRYRAERMLSEEFRAQRARVTATVASRLLARGASLDQSDLEACYAQAWQGLYAAMLAGEEIANPTGWLVLVTFRRAIDEHRLRARRQAAGEESPGADEDGRRRARPRAPAGHEPDYAARLDDRQRLRQLFEGMRGGLDAREREAAALCYLQGLSRAEAAARMGLSDRRMRKLMEGRGPGRPGVAGKVGALVESIAAGRWCAEQGSLMRALAYGVLDPDGERYRLALLHRRECPACSAYVRSLRGLAATLPPPLAPLALAGALGGGWSGQLAAHAGTTAGASTGGPGAALGAAGGAGAPVAAGAVSAGGGVAGAGGWLLAGGPLAGKLALGCVLALGIGAGCVALGGAGARHTSRRRPGIAATPALRSARPGGRQAAASAPPQRGAAMRYGHPQGAAASSPPTSLGAGRREFSPEQGGPQAPAALQAPAAATQPASARSSSARQAGAAPSAGGERVSAAEREFSPG